MIEAVPERVELKHEIYATPVGDRRGALRARDQHLLDAVTAIAAGASSPERVVGMHFFNPAPVMPLLEVIAGERSERLGARDRARHRARRWART